MKGLRAVLPNLRAAQRAYKKGDKMDKFKIDWDDWLWEEKAILGHLLAFVFFVLLTLVLVVHGVFA